MIPRFARPYAHALLKTTPGAEAIQQVRRELGNFAEAMVKLPELEAMMANPAVPMDAKTKVTSDVAEQLGLGTQAKSFVALLLSNYRVSHLGVILSVVDELLDRRLGKVKARVTSAAALNEDQLRRLSDLLARKLGKAVEIETSVDPSLLGGFVAQVGSDRYDVSLRGQLARLESSMADGTPDAPD